MGDAELVEEGLEDGELRLERGGVGCAEGGAVGCVLGGGEGGAGEGAEAGGAAVGVCHGVDWSRGEGLHLLSICNTQ